MKKIISLLSVFAMVLTMFTTVALADDNNKIYWVDVTEEGAAVRTLELWATTDMDLYTLSASYKLLDARNNGIAVTGVSADSSFTFNCTADNASDNKNVISFSITNVDGFTGTFKIGTFTFDFANATTDTLVIPQMRTMSAKDADKVVVSSSFTNAAADYTVTKPVWEEEVEYGCTPSADNYYIGEDGAVAVKAWDVVAPTVDGEETIEVTFTAGEESKTFDFKHGVTGGADVSFLALLINAPADVAMSLN